MVLVVEGIHFQGPQHVYGSGWGLCEIGEGMIHASKTKTEPEGLSFKDDSHLLRALLQFHN